ncbi:hypothetical protein GOV14_02030 [Candidatus Pacearchaeota archaeon]|nr:hypothetical protein [Candidatus Pacearchaeota archaeon]
MEKLTIQNIKGRLIPWKSPEELSQRISEYFDWSEIKDPNPGKLIYNTCGYDAVYHREQLKAVITQLPINHEINQEIIKRTKKNLIEILTKSPEELRGNHLRDHRPQYENAFYIGEVSNLDELFEDTKNAAYHIMNNPVLSTKTPQREDRIMFRAASSMLEYIKSKPTETKEFFNYLSKKMLTIAFMLVGNAKFKDEKIIETYFEIFNNANGQDVFMLDNIERGVSFGPIAKRFKRFFPDYNFKPKIEQSKPELRGQLNEMFGYSNDH